MPPSRASANELAKLLAAVGEPLYVVSAKRRLVFVNEACGAWTGSDTKELVGLECRYSASPDLTGADAIAAALCPPPEAWTGQRLKAQVVLPGRPDVPRQVEFIPLAGGEEGVAGVLAVAQPVALEESASSADETLGPELHARLQRYRDRLAIRYHVDRLLGDNPAMRLLRTQVKLAAASAVSVMVVAPPSSGEHVGRAIHYGDGNATVGPLVPLSCPLLDTDLLQATLRGLARNRTTGSQRPATLLLNEIDALGEGTQTELFRSLAGGDLPGRVVSTSPTPLADLVSKGLFRPDLACALSTLTIRLPPLAERMRDLPLLVQWYIEQINLRRPKQIGGCSPEALDRMADYSWPGDLGELEEMIEEAHAQAEGPLIAPHDLPQRLMLASQASARPAKADETIKLEAYLAEIEHELIERALARAKGNKTKAARLLGMTRPRFYRRLVQLGLDGGESGS
ncbi:MAG TPA: helix-turn-helix domain-containing protein [Pirellulales bacterium]|jgi:DNA-binding NtrC family response regulator|nr:helix-turn-helix domain-containing protein [Pirellulales bacterium]